MKFDTDSLINKYTAEGSLLREIFKEIKSNQDMSLYFEPGYAGYIIESDGKFIQLTNNSKKSISLDFLDESKKVTKFQGEWSVEKRSLETVLEFLHKYFNI